MHTSGGGGVSSPRRKLSRGPPGLSRRPTLAHSLQYESFVRLCLVSAWDTLEPSDSEDEMEAESALDNGDEEITDLVSDGENA